MHLAFSYLSIVVILFSCHGILGFGDGCEGSCPLGPKIRFPFRLKNRQPKHCIGYSPGFDLSCTSSGHTLLKLPASGRIYITDIDYVNQVITGSDPDGCFPEQARNFSLSDSPFQFEEKERDYSSSMLDFTVFSCPAAMDGLSDEATCLRAPGYFVYAVASYSRISILNLTSCTKIFDVSSLPEGFFIPNSTIGLSWSEPRCGRSCEVHGFRCGFKNNVTGTKTQCLNVPPRPGHWNPLVIAGIVVGSVVLVLALAAIGFANHAHRKARKNAAKIEKFLQDYKALKPTRYSYADLRRITSDFREKLGEGAYGMVFRGKLSNEISVAVKILNSSTGNGDDFINEVGTMGRIYHVNVVRMVGFCADGVRRALVYEFLPNESLEKFISSSDDDKDDKNACSLGWGKLQDIAIGIAKGIEYLHQGCDQRILHFDIKPHNILLDDNFTPKISDFGLAKLCAKDLSAVSMTTARGTMGYIAPEVFSRNFGNVSYKSDVYSFGMLLLEMVGGRKNVDVSVESTAQVYFPEWVYNHLAKGEELRIRTEEEGDAEIARKLSIVGLWCIQWYPVDRPSITVVVQMLEGGENLEMPPNPFAGPTNMGGFVPARCLPGELAVISESETE